MFCEDKGPGKFGKGKFGKKGKGKGHLGSIEEGSKKAVKFSEGAELEAEVGGLDICAMEIKAP